MSRKIPDYRDYVKQIGINGLQLDHGNDASHRLMEESYEVLEPLVREKMNSLKNRHNKWFQENLRKCECKKARSRWVGICLALLSNFFLFPEGRGMNKERLDRLPDGEHAEKKMTEILRKDPNDCSDEEKETFVIFVDIGLAAIDKTILEPLGAKGAYLCHTAQDLAWSIVNFKHYAAEDAPYNGGATLTRSGNPSVRKNRRCKIAATTSVQAKIAVDFTNLAGRLAKWNVAEDVENIDDRPAVVVERENIKKAWADYLLGVREADADRRENVAPSNGGNAKRGENPYKNMKFDPADFPIVCWEV